VLELLDERKVGYTLTDQLESSIGQVDILYMTRIQRERFQNPTEYRRLKGIYILDAEKMKFAKEDMIVLHPLPRVDEINSEVDADPRAWYFLQTQCGVLARMALIIKQLKLNDLLGDGLLKVHTCDTSTANHSA
jgi:aspartate carbamoyltransferase catalytic subunit